MHESSLMADMRRKLEAVAREQDATRIVAIHVQIGALAQISAAHLREHLTEAARGTAAEGARVEIEELDDAGDPRAQSVLLSAVEVEET